MAVAALAATAAWAGEILIIQPAAPAADKRNEVEARQNSEYARQKQSGKAAPEVVYILDAAGNLVLPEAPTDTERSRMKARGYIDSGQEGENQKILRAAPISEAERARLKARSYVVEQQPQSSSRCSTAANQVGMIGEGPGAQKKPECHRKGGGGR